MSTSIVPTSFESAAHLRSWLTIQQIKTELNDTILSSCMNPILQLFGENIDLVNFLVKHASTNRLKEVYNILHQKVQQFKEQTQKPSKTKPVATLDHCNFNNISSHSIENICAFLHRKDIKQFKLSSRRIAIICLNEMTKYSMSTFIASNLLHTKYSKKIEWKNIATSNIRRYKMNTTYLSIFQQIEQKHNFPQQFQIPTVVDSEGKHYKIDKYQTIIPKTSLILFDKRCMIIVWYSDENKSQVWFHSNPAAEDSLKFDKFVDFDNMAILTLSYFNIYRQEIKMIGQLIIDKHVDMNALYQVFEEQILKENSTDMYFGLKELMNEYPDDYIYNNYGMHRSISKGFGFDDNILTYCKDLKIISLAFQIDPDYISDIKQIKLTYELGKLQKFHMDTNCVFHALWDTTSSIKIYCKNVASLKQKLLDYNSFTNKVKEKEMNHIFDTLEEKFGNNKDSYFEVIYDQNLNYNLLKQYICKNILNDIIPYEYIEIYKHWTEDIIECVDTKRNQWGIYNHFSFQIVLYNTIEPCSINNKCVINIEIFNPTQAPFPFNVGSILSTNGMLQMTLKIQQRCTISDIINELNGTSLNPLFYYQLKTSNLSLNDKHIYGVMKKHYYGGYTMVYEQNDRIPYIGQSSYDRSRHIVKLFILSTKIRNASRNVRLKIRFAHRNNFNKNENIQTIKKKLIGFPLIIWVSKTDSLEYILNNNEILQKFEGFIFCVYRINYYKEDYEIKGNIEVIPKSQRNTFNLWENMLSENCDDFIVISLKKLNTNMQTDQLSFNPINMGTESLY